MALTSAEYDREDDQFSHGNAECDDDEGTVAVCTISIQPAEKCRQKHSPELGTCLYNAVYPCGNKALSFHDR